MKIKRVINNEEVIIELTSDEIGEAHKEFVTSWMASEVLTTLLEYPDQFSEEEAEEIADIAYDIYCRGDGLTEYEALEEGLEQYKKDYV